MSESAEKVAHDLLVEQVQRLTSKISGHKYDMELAEQNLRLAYTRLREFEAEHNLPKRM
jgi:hypothetical protein